MVLPVIFWVSKIENIFLWVLMKGYTTASFFARACEREWCFKFYIATRLDNLDFHHETPQDSLSLIVNLSYSYMWCLA